MIITRKKNGEILEDDIGAIHEILVSSVKGTSPIIATTLLKLAIKKLIDEGKTKAVCNVQEDNENRFLHFALADSNVLEKGVCKRTDGTETVDYTLLMDLIELQNKTGDEIRRKAAMLRRHHKQNSENLKNLV